MMASAPHSTAFRQSAGIIAPLTTSLPRHRPRNHSRSFQPTRTSPLFALSLEEMQALVTRARMVDAAAEFAAALREAGLSDVHHFAFEHENHGSVVAPAITRGLAVALPVLD